MTAVNTTRGWMDIVVSLARFPTRFFSRASLLSRGSAHLDAFLHPPFLTPRSGPPLARAIVQPSTKDLATVFFFYCNRTPPHECELSLPGTVEHLLGTDWALAHVARVCHRRMVNVMPQTLSIYAPPFCILQLARGAPTHSVNLLTRQSATARPWRPSIPRGGGSAPLAPAVARGASPHRWD